MSKITVAGVRQNVQQLLDYSNNEKKRNFLETVELQIGAELVETSRVTSNANPGNRTQEL